MVLLWTFDLKVSLYNKNLFFYSNAAKSPLFLRVQLLVERRDPSLISHQTVPPKCDSVSVNVFCSPSVFSCCFVCDSSGITLSLCCCQANNISSSSPWKQHLCVCVCVWACLSSLLSYPFPTTTFSPIQSLISSFIGKRWDKSFIFSLVMLFLYYPALLCSDDLSFVTAEGCQLATKYYTNTRIQFGQPLAVSAGVVTGFSLLTFPFIPYLSSISFIFSSLSLSPPVLLFPCEILLSIFPLCTSFSSNFPWFPLCRMNSAQLPLFPSLPLRTVIMLLIERGPSMCVRLLSCRESEVSIDAEIWGSVSKTITTYSPDTHTHGYKAYKINMHTHSLGRNDTQPSHYRKNAPFQIGKLISRKASLRLPFHCLSQG